MKRTGSLLGGLALAVLAGWLLYRSSNERGETAAPVRVGEPAFPAQPSQAVHPEAGRRVEPEGAGLAGGEAPAVEPPPETARRTVRVLAEKGEPVPGARLEVWRHPAGQPIESAASDAEGELELGPSRAGDEWRASAHGYAETHVVLDEPPWPAEVVLVAGALLLQGQVVDEADRPVPEARVRMTTGSRAWRAVSDARGVFELRSSDAFRLPDEVAFEIDAPGFCYLLQGVGLDLAAVMPPGSALQIQVLRWARLDVTVQDGAGREVAGASLRFLDPPSAFLGGGVALRGAAVPAPAGDGRYVMEQVPPLTELLLLVGHPELAEVEVPLAAFQPGELRARTVVLAGLLSDRGTISFRVVDLASGRPLAGAQATVISGSAGERSLSVSRADEEGRLELAPPQGDWELRVSASGFAPLRRRFEAAFRAAEPVVLALEPSDLALDVALIPAGAASRGAVLVRLREAWSGGVEVTARSDEAGLARFVGLDPEARYDVVIGDGRPGRYDLGGEGTWVPSPAVHLGVTAGGDPVVFRLVDPASVQGRILGGDLDGGQAQLSYVASDERREMPAFTVNCALDAQGGFAFHGLPPGHYHLWCRAAGSTGPYDPLLELDLSESQRVTGLVIP